MLLLQEPTIAKASCKYTAYTNCTFKERITMKTLKVQLSGGGLDSTAFTILEYGSLDMIVVANYGQLAYESENDAVQDVVAELKLIRPLLNQPIIDDAFSLNGAPMLEDLEKINPENLLFGTGDNGFIRARNIHLALYAANRAIQQFGTERPIELQFGLCHEQMMFSDANRDFITVLNKILNSSYGHIGNGTIRYPLIQVSAPYIRVAKLEYLKLAIKRLYELGYGRKGASELLFDTSFTCWTPDEDGRACGVCYHCEKQAKLQQELISIGVI